MIENHLFAVQAADNNGKTRYFSEASEVKHRPVFRMVDGDDRMAGSMPVWDSDLTQREKIAANLTYAGNNGGPGAGALAYAPNAHNGADNETPFGFGDLLDMVNPLQHIPIVSHIYRHLTGDDIRGASRIIGGTIFGGPMGAVSSMANIIAEEETGRDLLGNAMAMTIGGNEEVSMEIAQNSAPSQSAFGFVDAAQAQMAANAYQAASLAQPVNYQSENAVGYGTGGIY